MLRKAAAAAAALSFFPRGFIQFGVQQSLSASEICGSKKKEKETCWSVEFKNFLAIFRLK
jgi:hypothetical protein